MKRRAFIKRILAVALSIIIVLGLMPMTVFAYPGDGGAILTSNDPGQYDMDGRPLLVYVTPNGGYVSRTSGGNSDSTQQFTATACDGWVFSKWRTYYEGPSSNGINPNYTWGDEWCFSKPGNSESKPDLTSTTIQANREWDAKGTYYLYAIFNPIITVQIDEGVEGYRYDKVIKNGTGNYTENLGGSNEASTQLSHVEYGYGLQFEVFLKDTYVPVRVSVNGVDKTSEYLDAGFERDNGGTILFPTNSTTPVSDADMLWLTGSVTIEVTTRLINCIVQFDANGGNGTMTTQTFSYGETQALTENSFSKTGYTFAGWNTKADGTGTTYTDKQSVAFTPVNDGESITLYAKWKEVATYTAPTDNDLTYTGDAQELVSAGQSTEGTMMYSLEENGTYSATVPSATNAGDYTVYYYVKGSGDFADSEIQGIPVKIKKATPAASMFTYESPDDLYYTGIGKAAKVKANPDITGMGAVTVEYFNGIQKLDGTPTKPGTYTVRINVGEGANYAATTGLTAANWTFAVSCLDVDVAISGYAYQGDNSGLYWFKGGTAATVTAPVGYQIGANQNGTFSNSVSLAQGDGEQVYLCSESSGTIYPVDLSGMIAYDAVVPEITGIENNGTYYKQISFGFRDDQSGIASVLVDGQPAEVNSGKVVITADNREHTITVADYVGNITEYKIWVNKIYTVTFDANGGTLNGDSSTEATPAGTITLPTDPTRSGNYSFKGWYTAASGGREVTTSTVFDTDTTIYAQWTYTGRSGSDGGISSYVITVKDAKNGKVVSSHKSTSAGTTVTLTVEADNGYALETLTVTDGRGKEVEVTEKDGKYTFKMPAYTVTVEATFMDDNTMLNYFVDVPADAYYYDAVLWAAEEGITSGTDAVHFSPDATCTRAQAVTFLWRAAGSPEPESRVMPFVDVVADAYYYDAVLWAVENGITSGTTATTFAPNETCTRAQIVTFLWRSQKSPAAESVNPFTDVAVEIYYCDAVLWAVENGVTAGTTATTFSPDNDCTRAQIVTFMYRCIGK